MSGSRDDDGRSAGSRDDKAGLGDDKAGSEDTGKTEKGSGWIKALPAYWCGSTNWMERLTLSKVYAVQGYCRRPINLYKGAAPETPLNPEKENPLFASGMKKKGV